MRNFSVDSLKFVCAVLVVFLHVNSKGHAYYLPITRCAVPCFFMISGYFLMSENMKARLVMGCNKISRITAISTLLFAVVTLATHHFELSSIIPSFSDLAIFVLLNDNPWGFHLWYLGAYLYVLLICIIIDKYNKWNQAFMAVPILLVIDLIIGKYSILIMGHEFPYIYARNFLFVGLPYFLIGAYIKRKKFLLKKHQELAWGGGSFSFFDFSFGESTIVTFRTQCHKGSLHNNNTIVYLSVYVFPVKATRKADFFLRNR